MLMNSNTFGIIFYLRKYKAKDNKAPIYARITVDGLRAEFSMKRDIEMSSWNSSKGMAKPSKEEFKSLNNYLEQIRARLVECYQTLQLERKLITAEAIKNKFLGNEEKHHSLISLFDYHNITLKNTLEWGTMKNYGTTKKYVELFLKEDRKTSDVFLSQLNYKFIKDFELFLKSHQPKDHQKPCGQNTAMKHIERFRKIINMAVKYEWLNKDPFAQFKPVFKKTSRICLTSEELARIETKHFTIDRLKLVKDLFVFSCYTGLAYADVMLLTKDNITLGMDGKKWIFTNRKKTRNTTYEMVRVPLLPPALDIIEKYKKDIKALHKGTLFPSITNQNLNSYLKEIADHCNIEKNMTFHLARHTFATTVTLNNDVPLETVSKMLGHASIRTTQIYAKVLEKKISNDMNTLLEKMTFKSEERSTG